jgi:SMC interacting uncharacterized protein involved in chromosome segregation
MADTSMNFKKHIEDYKAAALLQANKKIKRLSIDIKLQEEKMANLKKENEELKKFVRTIKNSRNVTKRMTKEDFELYVSDVPMIRSEYVSELKIQLCDLYRRKLELEGKKDTEKNRALRHYNAIAMSAVLRDIEQVEKGEGIIEFDY